MNKLLYLFIVFLSITTLSSCRVKKTGEKVEDAIESVGDDIDDAADDVADEVEDIVD